MQHTFLGFVVIFKDSSGNKTLGEEDRSCLRSPVKGSRLVLESDLFGRGKLAVLASDCAKLLFRLRAYEGEVLKRRGWYWKDPGEVSGEASNCWRCTTGMVCPSSADSIVPKNVKMLHRF